MSALDLVLWALAVAVTIVCIVVSTVVLIAAINTIRPPRRDYHEEGNDRG